MAPVASARLLPQLVHSWRQLFDTPFTVGVVQLPAYGTAYETADRLPAARTRNALAAFRADQQTAASTVGRVFSVSTIDVGNFECVCTALGYSWGDGACVCREVGVAFRRACMRRGGGLWLLWLLWLWWLWWQWWLWWLW